MTHSTAATLCGQLVIFGGMQGLFSADSIHQLVDGQWTVIGSMSLGRWFCLVVSPVPDKMMIVGGLTGCTILQSSGVKTNSAEECDVTV